MPKMALPPTPTVDIHTHMYPPPYISLLRSRTTVPYIAQPDASTSTSLRLIILPNETTGRPIGPEYWSVAAKLAFMRTHGITTSVVSLANPWLDFEHDASEAARLATQMNDWFEDACAQAQAEASAGTGQTTTTPPPLFFFATLPTHAGAEGMAAEVERVARLRYCRGIVVGRSGAGEGLDDGEFEAVWRAIAREGLVVFVHPHYGLPAEVYGRRAAEFGHVLPLALGFPVETTIAVTRMMLAGVFHRLPGLRLLLAHSGGTLPFLAGRIQSCIDHDGHLAKEGRTIDVWKILKENILLDAVIYGEIGLKAAIESVGVDGNGWKKVMFGTDHPFFPPLHTSGDGEWASVTSNKLAIEYATIEDKEKGNAVLGQNAIDLLNLH